MAESTEVKATKVKTPKAPKDPTEVAEKSFAVLTAARGMSGDFTAADIAEKMGVSARQVNGSLTALSNKGFITRGAATSVEVDVNGKKEKKTVRFITVTEAGKSPALHAAPAKAAK